MIIEEDVKRENEELRAELNDIRRLQDELALKIALLMEKEREGLASSNPPSWWKKNA
jgi:hypothetical protein